MEEFLFFILGMIAESLGLKKKAAPAPMSPARRIMPPSSPPTISMGKPTIPPLSRRLDAGDPLVSAGASTASFATREQALQAEQPPAFSAPPLPSAAPPQPAPVLFAGTDDFVRAFMLQEALGPPLCHRRGAPP